MFNSAFLPLLTLIALVIVVSLYFIVKWVFTKIIKYRRKRFKEVEFFLSEEFVLQEFRRTKLTPIIQYNAEMYLTNSQIDKLHEIKTSKYRFKGKLNDSKIIKFTQRTDELSIRVNTYNANEALNETFDTYKIHFTPKEKTTYKQRVQWFIKQSPILRTILYGTNFWFFISEPKLPVDYFTYSLKENEDRFCLYFNKHPHFRDYQNEIFKRMFNYSNEDCKLFIRYHLNKCKNKQGFKTYFIDTFNNKTLGAPYFYLDEMEETNRIRLLNCTLFLEEEMDVYESHIN